MAISIIRRIKKSRKPLKSLMGGRAILKQGPYGMYIQYKGKNTGIPKTVSVDEITDDFIKKLEL